MNRRFSDLADVIEHERERFKVPGIAVGILVDGKLHAQASGVASLETGFPVLPGTLYQIGSNSKVFTTTLLMTLVDEGKVDLDALVTHYLPDLRLGNTQALETLSVRHLVTHQSGIYGDYFEDFGWGADALARTVEQVHTLPHWFQPGELWTYTNVAFNIAGLVIERVLDQPFELAMRERIFEPLGLERTFYFPWEVYAYPHAMGHVRRGAGDDAVEVSREFWLNRALGPAGAIHSTVGDILAFDQFHMTGRTKSGASILSETSRLAMQEPRVRAAPPREWGLGWGIRTVEGVKIIGHGGGTNGFITRNTVVPDRGVAVAIFTNSARGGAAIREIERWLLDQHAGLQLVDPSVVALDQNQLTRYAGTYRNPKSRVDVSVADGTLLITLTHTKLTSDDQVTEPAVTYHPAGGLTFMATVGDEAGELLDFIPASNGDAIRFLRQGGRLFERE